MSSMYYACSINLFQFNQANFDIRTKMPIARLHSGYCPGTHNRVLGLDKGRNSGECVMSMLDVGSEPRR